MQLNFKTLKYGLLVLIFGLAGGCASVQEPDIGKTSLPNSDYGFLAFQFHAAFTGREDADHINPAVSCKVARTDQVILPYFMRPIMSGDVQIYLLPPGKYQICKTFGWLSETGLVVGKEPSVFTVESRAVTYIGKFNFTLQLKKQNKFESIFLSTGTYLESFDFDHKNNLDSVVNEITEKIFTRYGDIHRSVDVNYQTPYRR